MRIENWFYDHFGKVIIIIFVSLFAFIAYIANEKGNEKATFMAECLQFHRQFECISMWRRGADVGSSTIAPIILPR